jgi:type IV secretion system protein VirD4
MKSQSYSEKNPQKRIDKFPCLLIGKHPTKNEFLASYGQTFLMLAAPPGSGKGVAMVTPNLLNYPDSIVCNDPKFENYGLTAGFRHYCGHKVYRFSPEILETHRWNPLSRLSRDELYRLGDVRELASVLFTADNPKNKGWYIKAGDVFIAIILYLMDNDNFKDCLKLPVTLPQAYEIAALGEGLGEWAADVIAEHNAGKKPLTDETLRELGRIVSESKNKSGWPTVLGILTEALSLYGEKTLVWALSGDDIRFDMMRQEKMSVYFCVTQGALEKFGKLMNLFYSQIIRENGKVLPEQGGNNPDGTLKYKYQLCLIMDELAVMGRIETLKTAPALMRGAGLRFLLIFQGKAQIRTEDLYGVQGADAIMDAIHIEVVYAPGNISAAEEYSKRLGTKTVKVDSFSFGKGNAKTRNQALQPRALMLPQEIKDMTYQEELIFLQGNQKSKPLSIKARKLFWYEEPVFKERVNMPLPPIPIGDKAQIDNLVIPMHRMKSQGVKLSTPEGDDLYREQNKRDVNKFDNSGNNAAFFDEEGNSSN